MDNRRLTSTCLVAVCTGLLALGCTKATGTSASAAEGRSSSAPGSVVVPDVDYTPIPLERLVGTADLTVIGTVETVDADSLGVRVIETLQGEPVGDEIAVERVKPPEIFAPREAPFERGQDFVFFLSSSGGTDDEPVWSILGHPIAGELPVEGGFVYFDSYDLDEFAFESFEVHGVTRPMQRFPLDEFRDAVATYRDCFVWSQVETARNVRVVRRWEPAIVGDDATLQSYRARSSIHDYLAGVTLRQVPDRGER